jgi:hypothetical protein
VQKKVDEAKHVAKDAASSAVDKAKSHTGSGDSYASTSTGPNGFGRATKPAIGVWFRTRTGRVRDHADGDLPAPVGQPPNVA